MKSILLVIWLACFSSCSASERWYTGSTPGGIPVKKFLGIPVEDSIDFIRWKLKLDEYSYSLNCNYGIGKPNTKGFMEGGKQVSFSGNLRKKGNYYFLETKNGQLALYAINSNLLHPVNTDKSFMTGTGGWSYTLSNENPSQDNHVNAVPQKITLRDSMAYHGRTPCPGLDERKECLKLKWSVVLFADPKTNTPTTYRLKGTAYRESDGKTGNWSIQKMGDGKLLYRLEKGKRTDPVYLMPAGENILLFTDSKGNPLVGDEDFSYTLSRK